MLENVPYLDKSAKHTAVDLDRVHSWDVIPPNKRTVTVFLKNGTSLDFLCLDPESSVKLIEWFSIRCKGGNIVKELFGDLKKYLSENRDLVYTILFVLIIDEYVFQGAFRDRVKSLVDGFLRKAETKAGVISVAPTKVE